MDGQIHYATTNAKDGVNVDDLLADAESDVLRISESRRNSDQDSYSLGQLIPAAINEIHKWSSGGMTGLSTGLAKFDDMTTGLHPGDLIILAGRPSMGKTALAMNWVEHSAMLCGRPVGVFSMEMPALQLAVRLISSHARVDQKALRTGELNTTQWARINSAAINLQKGIVEIDDSSALSPADLRSRARRMKREKDIGLIVVDYLQLMQVPGSNENRTNEISEISRSLKALAKDLDLPVVALAQLNRSVEQRDNKRPRMSDLRDSGGIEQDADLIVFIYRDEVYNPDSIDKGTAELIVAKQRNGPIGKVRVAFINQITRFENLASDLME